MPKSHRPYAPEFRQRIVELVRKGRSWPQRAEVDKGGHFAARGQPQLFSEELRAAFRSLRGSP